MGGHLPSLFPHKLKPEEHLTSRLMAVLIAVGPFRHRFFEHTKDFGGRSPTSARQRASRVRAIALLEPRLNPSSTSRADAVISIRNGSRPPWRCVLEIKYLSQSTTSKEGVKKNLVRSQIARTYKAAKKAKFDHMLTISHQTATNGLNPSGFVPSTSTGATRLSHLSWLDVGALLQFTLEEDADSLDVAAKAILLDLSRHLRASRIWNYANNVSLGKSEFATVRDECRRDRGTQSDSLLTQQAFHEVAVRWQQFAAASAKALTTRTGIGFSASTSGLRALPNKIRNSGCLELELKGADPTHGSVHATVNLRERRLETAWVVDIAEQVPAQRPRTRTRWDIVHAVLNHGPAGPSAVEVIGVDGQVLLRRGTVSLIRRRLERDTNLSQAAPESVRFARHQTLPRGKDLTGSNITPRLNDMLLKTTPW